MSASPQDFQSEIPMDDKGFKVKYFVLKPKGTDQFAKASRAAMRTFAQSMHGHDNELSDYVKAWAESETPDNFVG